MSARRPPLGTEPPAARGSTREVSGTIEPSAPVAATATAGATANPMPAEATAVTMAGEATADTATSTAMAVAIHAHRKAIEADAEHSVIVQIDDDWLARLEIPLD